jgi:hypothetical protein
MDTLVYTLFPPVPVIAEGATQEQRESIKIGAGIVLEKAKSMANTVERIRVHNDAIGKIIEVKENLQRYIGQLQAAFEEGFVNKVALRPYYAQETVIIKQSMEMFLLTDSFIRSVKDLVEKTRPKDAEEWNPRIAAVTDPVIRRALLANEMIRGMENVTILDSPHIRVRGQIFMTVANPPKEAGVADPATFGMFLFAPQQIKDLTPEEFPIVHPFFKDSPEPAREFSFNYDLMVNQSVMKYFRVEGLM